jgi:hypothetical protein
VQAGLPGFIGFPKRGAVGEGGSFRCREVGLHSMARVRSFIC